VYRLATKAAICVGVETARSARTDDELRLEPDETVPVEIEIWPSSTRFDKGERLRVIIQGTDIYRFDFPAPQNLHRTRNAGEHS